MSDGRPPRGKGSRLSGSADHENWFPEPIATQNVEKDETQAPEVACTVLMVHRRFEAIPSDTFNRPLLPQPGPWPFNADNLSDEVLAGNRRPGCR
jgi:hypothetical protein